MSMPASTNAMVRLTVVLIAAWSVAAGLMLTLFQGTGAGSLTSGVADPAGQRLAGAHMLLLVPLYVLMFLRPERYGVLLWVPFFAQTLTAGVVAYAMLRGETDVLDGLPLMAVCGGLAALLGFFWLSEQREDARQQMESTLSALDEPDEV